MTYEYKSLINGETHTFNKRLTDEEMAERQLKRVWAVGFQVKTVDWGH
jgi:hypothetical protein